MQKAKWMWKENKYARWYFSLVQRGQNRETDIGYYEKHHIIPKSLGGSNVKENLVKLTAREHFICHLLLIKCLADTKARAKMVHAAWFFQGNIKNSNLLINSHTYEKLKIQRSKLIKNKKQTPEHIAKRAIANTGKIRTAAQRKKISEGLQMYVNTKHDSKIASERAKAGHRSMSDETRQKMKIKQSNAKLGKKMSEEAKRHLSEVNTGRIQPDTAKVKSALTHIARFSPKPLIMKQIPLWHIETVNGEILYENDLRNFAKTIMINERQLRNSIRTKMFINGYRVIKKTMQQVPRSISKQRKTDLFAAGLIYQDAKKG